MEFKNKTVIVTGASVGIGRATALEFAREGASLCLVDVNGELLENTRRDAEALGATVSTYACDVSDEAGVREVTADILERYGRIDVLVNNAGLWRGSKPFVETTSDDWKKRIDVNILGLMYFTHEVLPNMIEKGYGRIINVGSVAGVYGIQNMAAYSMTKGAVSSFTKALAKEVAAVGITVNNVVPGSVRNEGAAKETDMSYMNRRGELEEYAYLICFLASDKAAYISGQDYQIDGCRRKN
jgi:NAD(P)-dependent dehydrogenase (short-subunit alcohol dehydrogenase family)